MRAEASAWIEALFSGELFHEYDPVKAREYYMRTRELKGREPGKGDPESAKRAAAAAAEAEARQDDVEVQREKLKELLKIRLEELEVRLEQLKTAVKQGKLAAMRRAGVSEETLSRMITQEVKSPGSTKGGTEVEPAKGGKTAGGEAGSESSDDKPKTQKQKNDAAKAAKEKYEEEKANNPDPDQQLADLQEKVDSAMQNIEKMQEKVEAMNRIGAKA